MFFFFFNQCSSTINDSSCREMNAFCNMLIFLPRHTFVFFSKLQILSYEVLTGLHRQNHFRRDCMLVTIFSRKYYLFVFQNTSLWFQTVSGKPIYHISITLQPVPQICCFASFFLFFLGGGGCFFRNTFHVQLK